jgi:outer membrane immunogenic protein
MMRPEQLVRRGRVMRVVGFVLAIFAFLQQAHAADMSGVLRGAMVELGRPATVRWGGYYVGGQFGHSSASMDLSQAHKSQVAFMLHNLMLENEHKVSEWPIMGAHNMARPTYGGFAGFNGQWGNTIFGIELNYNSADFRASGAGATGRRSTVTSGLVYDTTVITEGRMHITDFGTARLRAGYSFGGFLGYGFVGLAVGRANVERTSLVFGTETDPTTSTDNPFSFGPEVEKRQMWLHGYAFGAGLDWALGQNIFLRAEYEFVDFYPFSDMTTYINTVRGAVGLKF